MPTLERIDGAHVLDLGDGGNLINPAWIRDVAAAIEEVAASAPPRALVTTGSGGVFSLGLDLGWIAANRDGAGELVASMHELFGSMLELGAPTVAALPGHTFAGGLLFALAHDQRVMRADRGWACLPEVDGQIAFTPGLVRLVAARLAPQVAHEALLTARRYGGEEAARLGIVDEAAAAEAVLPRAIERARALSAKHPETWGAIRAHLYRDTIAALRDREANAVDAGDFDAALAMMAAAGS